MAHKQSVRQAARREAFERQTRRQQEQAQRDKRRNAVAIKLVVALRERAEAEVQAAEAIAALTAEGLTHQEISTWVDGEIDTAEVARLAAGKGASAGSKA